MSPAKLNQAFIILPLKYIELLLGKVKNASGRIDINISDLGLLDSILTGPKTCFNITWFIYNSPSHFIIPMNYNKNPVD